MRKLSRSRHCRRQTPDAASAGWFLGVPCSNCALRGWQPLLGRVPLHQDPQDTPWVLPLRCCELSSGEAVLVADAVARRRASPWCWGSGCVQGCLGQRVPSPGCSGAMCTRGRQSPTLRWWDLGAWWDWVPHGMRSPVPPLWTHGGRCWGFSQHRVQLGALRMLPHGAGSSLRAQVWSSGWAKPGPFTPWGRRMVWHPLPWSLGRRRDGTLRSHVVLVPGLCSPCCPKQPWLLLGCDGDRCPQPRRHPAGPTVDRH